MTKEALELSLEALTYIYTETTADEDELIDQAITAIKEALAQQAVVGHDLAAAYRTELDKLSQRNYELRMENAQLKAQPKEQEPVAWMVWGENNVPSLTFKKPSDKYVFDFLYTTPPQRTWVGLTQDELNMIGDSMRTWNSWTITDVYFAIEAKLKEKNH